jgi:hypothetical protein
MQGLFDDLVGVASSVSTVLFLIPPLTTADKALGRE